MGEKLCSVAVFEVRRLFVCEVGREASFETRCFSQHDG